ncbi:MAG TPA: histidine phosphatase family protein [Stellaceae bacterium]|nr:histidine phosphatase family protein [Stellaceae bacterium]
MSLLWLLRHAKAAPQAEGQEDRDRPLAAKGEQAMRELGTWAARQKLAPELVLCSSSARTRQSLALLLPSLAGRPEVMIEGGLYLADPGDLLVRLRRVPARCGSVLVVGHNPGLHEFAVLLTRSASGPLGRRLSAGMPTGALAGFALDGPWSALDHGAARLTHYVTPKELRDA